MNLRADMKDWKNWVSLGARLVLGIVLIWAGATKVGDLTASSASVKSYQMVRYELAEFLGHTMPFAEIGLGILLVIGLFTRVSGALGALMMIAFIIAIASVWARGIAIDCGCFGTGGPVEHEKAMAAYPWEIARDVGLAACGVWLVVIKKPFLAVDTWLFRPVEEMIALQDRRKRR